MNLNYLDYGSLVDRAMHLIVHDVLLLVEKHGFPNDHHFFISFLTHSKDVRIPEELSMKYPKAMTIVIRHQYKNLHVTQEGFEVTLLFAGVEKTIYIPFKAITTFADPSVQFGLQFRISENAEAVQDNSYDMDDSQFYESSMQLDSNDNNIATAHSANNNVIRFDSIRKKSVRRQKRNH